MKKLITICITFALVLALIPAAFADWDLSGLTFDDLIALRAQIQLEMMSRGEWEEVEVPQGVYQVGVDIPAGTWTIRSKGKYYTGINVGTALRENKADVVFPPNAFATIYNVNGGAYDESKLSEWTVTVSNGEYVVVEDGPAIFTTYTGKPSLGFKALS